LAAVGDGAAAVAPGRAAADFPERGGQFPAHGRSESRRRTALLRTFRSRAAR